MYVGTAVVFVCVAMCVWKADIGILLSETLTSQPRDDVPRAIVQSIGSLLMSR